MHSNLHFVTNDPLPQAKKGEFFEAHTWQEEMAKTISNGKQQVQTLGFLALSGPP